MFHLKAKHRLQKFIKSVYLNFCIIRYLFSDFLLFLIHKIKYFFMVLGISLDCCYCNIKNEQYSFCLMVTSLKFVKFPIKENLFCFAYFLQQWSLDVLILTFLIFFGTHVCIPFRSVHHSLRQTMTPTRNRGRILFLEVLSMPWQSVY